MLGRSPNNQDTINIFDEWASILPDCLDSVAKPATANLFADDRVSWALNVLGGAKDKSVLELGPFEAGHTYMLHNAGASDVVSIEANKKHYLKCLIIKELCNLKNNSVLYGDFLPWLEQTDRKFDIIWCAGVLYHMKQPLQLLELISQHTDRIHIWTHYIPDDFDAANIKSPLLSSEKLIFNGVSVEGFVRSYLDALQINNYCGGVYPTAFWLRRESILSVLRSFGYTVEIAFEDSNHPNGACFALAVYR